MKCFGFLWQGGRLAFSTMAGWLAIYGTALAQPAKKEAESPGGSYVLPYALVILGIGLGMMFVCRSSGRRERAKPEQYDEAKLNLKE